MKTLFEKSMEMQTRTVQKMKEVLQEREDMRTQMEEAFTAKDAVSTDPFVHVFYFPPSSWAFLIN